MLALCIRYYVTCKLNPKNERFSVVCSLCFQNLKCGNFTLLFCRALAKKKRSKARDARAARLLLPFKQSNCVFAALALPQWFLKNFPMDASILLGPSPTTHCLRLGDTAQGHH